MPTEGRLFREVDGTWRTIMAACVAEPKALEAESFVRRDWEGMGTKHGENRWKPVWEMEKHEQKQRVQGIFDVNWKKCDLKLNHNN